MIDILISAVQGLCLSAYLYGAWLVITHRADAGPGRGPRETSSAQRAEDAAAWERYLACDA